MTTDSVHREPLFYNAGGFSGDGLSPLLNRDLLSNEILIRQNALMAMSELMHNPSHIADAVRLGMVASLTKLLKSPDVQTRERATQVLHVIAGHAVGRQAFITNSTIMPLSALIVDGSQVVRHNAHLALQATSEGVNGAAALIENGLVAPLVRRLAQEQEDIQAIILGTLYNCIKHNPTPALAVGAMAILTDLTTHYNNNIRVSTARAIMALSFPFEGKRKAVEANSVELLASLLEDTFIDVRAAAAGAIMAITLQKEGKMQMLNNTKGCMSIKKMLTDKDQVVRLNSIKIITNLAESPKGREIFEDTIPILLSLAKVTVSDNSTYGSAAVEARSADIAIKIITWKP